MTEEIKNLEGEIKTALALAGDVWLSQEQIQTELASKGFPVEMETLNPQLSRMCVESEIVFHRNRYALHCHQYF